MTTGYILDCYYNNTLPDLALAARSGLIGVIHKCSEGLTFTDPLYMQRRATAESLGLLWGAYHFGHQGNAVAQADRFLSLAGTNGQALLCLDLERALDGTVMTLADAEQFVQRVWDRTGRWPVVYSAKWVMDIINPQGRTTILSKCPLWVASYNPLPVWPKSWASWTIWQYTNGTDGPQPHMIDGLSHNDYNLYNGTLDELKTFWKGNLTDLGRDAFITKFKGAAKTDPIRASVGVDPQSYVFPVESVAISPVEAPIEPPPPPPPQPGPTEILAATDNNINVRSKPSLSGTILRHLNKGDVVTVYQQHFAADGYNWANLVPGPGWVADKYLAVPPKPLAASSVFGMHLLMYDNLSAIADILAAGIKAGRPVRCVTVFSAGGQNVSVKWIKDRSPLTKVVYRHYESEQFSIDWSDEKGAYKIGYDHAMALLNSLPADALLADYIQPLVNEPPPGAATDEFWNGVLDAFDASGRHAAIFDFGVGIPDLSWWSKPEWQVVLRRAKAKGHILLLHEYVNPALPNGHGDWAGAGAPDAIWYAMRHTQIYSILPIDCQPMLVCGEFGDEKGAERDDAWLLRNLHLVETACKGEDYLLSLNLWSFGNNGPGNWTSDDLTIHAAAFEAYLAGLA